MIKLTLCYISHFTDLEEEKICLAKAAVISLTELPSHVPSDQARYHLYIFKHTHEGDHMESIGMDLFELY